MFRSEGPLGSSVVHARKRAGWAALEALAARARATAQELRGEGAEVRFLRAVFVPEEEACFLLYQAPSPQAAAEAAERASLAVARVVEAVQAGHRERST